MQGFVRSCCGGTVEATVVGYAAQRKRFIALAGVDAMFSVTSDPIFSQT